MPTEVSAVLARKRLAETQMQGDVTIMLICTILCLVNILSLYFDQALAEATVLMGLY
jgi:hypothetical protein